MTALGAGLGAGLSAAGPALDPLRLDLNGLRPGLWPRNGVAITPDPAPAPFTPVHIINTGGQAWHRCNLLLTRPLDAGEMVWIRVRTADGTSATRRIGPTGPNNAASLLTGPLSALSVTRQDTGPLTLMAHSPAPGGGTDLELRYACTLSGTYTIAIGPETLVPGHDVIVWGCQVTTERAGWLLG